MRAPDVRRDSARRGAAIALARSQHGAAAHRQLLEIGLHSSAIYRRVRSGEYRRLFRGVYLIGGIRTPKTMPMAAALACGRRSFISHHAAAGLYVLRPAGGPIDVTVVGHGAHPRPGLRIRRTRSLGDDEVTCLDRIPLTTPARTIIDLAASLDLDDLEQVIATAFRRKAATTESLRTLLDRYPVRAGTRALRQILGIDMSPAFTRSAAERRLLQLIRRAGLPEPRVNSRQRGFEVDLLWPEFRFGVEIDGHQWHADRVQRERDMDRDQELDLHGFLIIRVSWRQISQNPEVVIARIARHLERRAPAVVPASWPRPR